jgi:hypothetical protein
MNQPNALTIEEALGPGDRTRVVAAPFEGKALRMPTLPVPVSQRLFFLPIPLEVLDRQRHR